MRGGSFIDATSDCGGLHLSSGRVSVWNHHDRGEEEPGRAYLFRIDMEDGKNPYDLLVLNEVLRILTDATIPERFTRRRTCSSPATAAFSARSRSLTLCG